MRGLFLIQVPRGGCGGDRGPVPVQPVRGASLDRRGVPGPDGGGDGTAGGAAGPERREDPPGRSPPHLGRGLGEGAPGTRGQQQRGDNVRTLGKTYRCDVTLI